MKRSNYSVHVHWDKRYPKKGTDKCPVQISVNLNGLQFKIGLGLYASKEDFDKAMSGRSGNQEVKELRSEINKYVTKAEQLLERLPNPTRDIFQRLFKSETDLFQSSKTDITFLYEEYLLMLRSEERIKTASNYEQAFKSLKAYRGNLYFEEIDVNFLKGYVNWMVKEGNSASSAQIYLRSLRAIFNKAIKDGYISSKFYPFNQYSIGGSAKSKDVLYPEQIKLLYTYQGTRLAERRAKDYWLFCYLSNGINPKDMIYLKFKNIDGEYISFVREKTKRTNTIVNKQIKVYLHPEMKRIIEDWGNKTDCPEQYIFPILHDDRYKTALDKEKRRNQVQRKINKELKSIGNKLGFSKPLILNLARHSFGTNLKLNGTPTEFIKDALGHSSSKTTEHYLKSLPDQKMKELSKTLLQF